MAAIQVRDIPDHIYRLLAERAKRERRSLAQEAVVTLARGLQVEVDAKGRRKALLATLQSVPAAATERFSDPARLIREDRLR
jgi:plasmid stability protein